NPGMPADAHGVVSVGAADISGRPRPYTAAGPALAQELLARPDVFSFDALPGISNGATSPGTGLANGFAAGLTGSVFSSKGGQDRFIRDIKAQSGQLLRAP